MANQVNILSRMDLLVAASQEENTTLDTDNSSRRGCLGMAILLVGSHDRS